MLSKKPDWGKERSNDLSKMATEFNAYREFATDNDFNFNETFLMALQRSFL